MISKLRSSFVALILLVLVGFGFQNWAKAQGPGTNSEMCPFTNNTIGWLQTSITPLTPVPNVSIGLIGTIESGPFGINIVAGMDWQHVMDTSNNELINPPSNSDGSQLITWWTFKGARDTFIQVTNDDENDFGWENDVNGVFGGWVHVRFLDENCVEILDYCDFYSANETHIYDLANLVNTAGKPIQSGALKGHEGFMTVTSVNDCPDPDEAFAGASLVGTVQISDTGMDNYGFNAYARSGVCLPSTSSTDKPFNLIANGSFQCGTLPQPQCFSGELTGWNQDQQGDVSESGVIDASSISPTVPVPVCDDPLNPDCINPHADQWMAFILSDSTHPGGAYGDLTLSSSAIAKQIRTNNAAVANDLIDTGVLETNVTILESNAFTPGSSGSSFVSNTMTVLYDLSFLAQNTTATTNFSTCNNFAAVCVVDNKVPAAPLFIDCECYLVTPMATNGTFNNLTGTCPGPTCTGGTFKCTQVTTDSPIVYTISPYKFQGGKSSFIAGSLTGLISDGTHPYVVQVITGQGNNTCFANTGTAPNTVNATVGALIDNFRNIEVEAVPCDGTLTGAANAFLENFTPFELDGQFNLLAKNAGSDVVMINFEDVYTPKYTTIGANIAASVDIWDDTETPQSCGSFDLCFSRLGIDDSIIISDKFVPPTIPPTIGPTIGPTIRPTIGPTTPPTGFGSSGGGCAIAGNQVELGTAFANLLIPLVPVAFAFGVRVVRKRKK